MTLEQRKALLLDYKLDKNDFYVVTDEFGDKIILRRTGIDKIQWSIKMKFAITSIQTVPYGAKVCVTIVSTGRLEDGDYALTTACANPDNCDFPNYAEVAEKRCRHRLILQLARLYEHNIFSEVESQKWVENRNKYTAAVSEVQKMLQI